MNGLEKRNSLLQFNRIFPVDKTLKEYMKNTLPFLIDDYIWDGSFIWWFKCKCTVKS